MDDDAAFVLAGYSFDFRRLPLWQWVIVLAFVWAPPVAIGFAIGFAARPVETESDEEAV